jgi:hypothetical protein
MASVKEAFTYKYQSTKNSGIEETTFSPGDEVEVVKEWSNDMCLVRDADGVVFNVPTKNLNL